MSADLRQQHGAMENIAESDDAVDRAVDGAVDRAIDEAVTALLGRQNEDGHWVFELEADATIPAEYILLNHFLGTPDAAVEAKLASYLRRIQAAGHGGWPLYHAGDFNVSATVKAYYALKLAGDDPDAPHMRRAREAVLAHGGAARSNVFTRYTLALFGQVPWHAVPTMPVEVVLLPKWFPFHLDKVSYWSRTVMVPLLVLASLKPRAVNPRGIGIAELFTVPPAEEPAYHANPTGSRLGAALLKLDSLLRRAEPFFPAATRRRAIRRAMEFVDARLNGEDGLGGIFPAMANALMCLHVLGRSEDQAYRAARKALDDLLVFNGDEAYCQPCFSPVWDTGLAVQALIEAGMPTSNRAIRKAAEWLRHRQVLDAVGDWAAQRPDLRPGGWAFQYRNDHYPDIDDTAVVAMALDRAGRESSREAIDRAAEWLLGMQSQGGGWAAFDADNTRDYLDHIPFADHGALLDPPSVDVTARCISFLAQTGLGREQPRLAAGLDYMRREQEEDGSWFGRWGTNYVYGTWSALSAFNAAGEDMNAPHIRKAVAWLKARQRPDGGWGEDCASYWPERADECKGSTPSQTAWALLALMAAGEVDSEAVRRGVAHLLEAPWDGERWREDLFTAVGFPRVFYLRYHGYSLYFPLWALARYRNLRRGNARLPIYGL